MNRYTLQIGPGEPNMVKCEGGAWVRLEDVDRELRGLEALSARWQLLNARQYRLNVIQFWCALFFSACFAATFFAEGKPVHAAIFVIWTAIAAMWSVRAWPIQEKQ